MSNEFGIASILEYFWWKKNVNDFFIVAARLLEWLLHSFTFVFPISSPEPSRWKKDCSLWERDCCVAYEQDQNTVRDLENRDGIRDLISNQEAGFAKFCAQMGDWERKWNSGLLRWEKSGMRDSREKGEEMRDSREKGVGNAGLLWIPSENARSGLSF